MRRKPSIAVAIVVTVMVSAVSGWGYITTFSQAEGYDPGPLDGQDGWTTFPPESSSFTVYQDLSGSYLQVSGSQDLGFPLGARTYAAPENSATLTSITFSYTPDQNEYAFCWGTEADPQAPFAAPVSVRIVDTGEALFLLLNGQLATLLTPQTLYQMDVTTDFTERTASLSLDGTPLLDGVSFNASGAPGPDPGFFYIIAPGTGFTLYLREIGIGPADEIPEPTALALLGLGACLLNARRRRR